MVRAAVNRYSSRLQSTLEQILSLGQISRQEHLQLTSAILADHSMSDEERREINRVFDYVQTGRLRMVD